MIDGHDIPAAAECSDVVMVMGVGDDGRWVDFRSGAVSWGVELVGDLPFSELRYTYFY